MVRYEVYVKVADCKDMNAVEFTELCQEGRKTIVRKVE